MNQDIKTYFSQPLSLMKKGQPTYHVETIEGEEDKLVIIQTCISRKIIENFPVQKQTQNNTKIWREQFTWL